MPVFEYKCNECNNTLFIQDVYENVKDIEPVKCEQCNREMVKQFCTHFQLKGGGWAKDNYQSSQYKK